MTVKELIEMLKEKPDDATVFLEGDDGETYRRFLVQEYEDEFYGGKIVILTANLFPE